MRTLFSPLTSPPPAPAPELLCCSLDTVHLYEILTPNSHVQTQIHNTSRSEACIWVAVRGRLGMPFKCALYSVMHSIEIPIESPGGISELKSMYSMLLSFDLSRLRAEQKRRN